MPEKKNKKVKFRENNDIRSYSNNSEKIEYRKSVPKSHRDKLLDCDIDKLKKFPCRYRGITFDNADDILEYMELKSVNLGLKRENVVDILKYSGNYKKKIPQENRLYNLDTGEIHDVLDYIPAQRRRTRTTESRGGGTRKRSKKRV